MVKKYIYSGMSAILLLVGCAGPRGAGMPVPRPLGRDLQSFHASLDGVDQPVSNEVAERQDSISLRHALSCALMQNPELKAFSHNAACLRLEMTCLMRCPITTQLWPTFRESQGQVSRNS